MDTITTYVNEVLAKLPNTLATTQIKNQLILEMNELYQKKQKTLPVSAALSQTIQEFGDLKTKAEKIAKTNESTDSNDQKLTPLLFEQIPRLKKQVTRSSHQLAYSQVYFWLALALAMYALNNLNGWLWLLVAIGIALSAWLWVLALAKRRSIKVQWQTAFVSLTQHAQLLEISKAKQASASGWLVVSFFCFLLAGLNIVVGLWLGLIASDLLWACVLLAIACGLSTAIFARSRLWHWLLSDQPKSPVRPFNWHRLILVSYWIAIVLIYLIWTFIFAGVRVSWILFILAGVGYGLIIRRLPQNNTQKQTF